MVQKSAEQTNKAFTLIELSIVVVIIGLIVAGVVAGQSLVRQAKLKNVLTDTDKMRVAIQSFKLQYNYFPGDIPNAFDYWGTACAVSAAACNGNGNGVIKTPSALPWTEEFRTWKHLELAGMVPGTYTGAALNGQYGGQAGINVYASSLREYAAFTFNYGAIGGLPDWHQIRITRDRPPGSGGNMGGSVMTPQEASAIDLKADDGIPNKGRSHTLKGGEIGGTLCVAADGASYLLQTDTSISCRMFYAF